MRVRLWLVPVGALGALLAACPAHARGVEITINRSELGNTSAFDFSDGQEVAPTSYSCRGTLAGKVLAPRSRCRWNIPKNARGKRFSVVVMVGYGGYTGQSGAFTFRVRA
jgi:hypothetical protein